MLFLESDPILNLCDEDICRIHTMKNTELSKRVSISLDSVTGKEFQRKNSGKKMKKARSSIFGNLFREKNTKPKLTKDDIR